MVAPALAKPRVFRFLSAGRERFVAVPFRFGQPADLDPRRVGEAERELVTVDRQFHRVAHGRKLDDIYPRAGNDAHVEKMLAQRPRAAHGNDDRRLPGGQFV